MRAPLDLVVRDSVHEPGVSRGAIQVDESLEGHPRYRVWLFVEGPDLPYLKSVTYQLHPTFPDPVRRVERTASNAMCALPIWTWGLFQVRTDLEDKRGGIRTVTHEMRYDRELTGDARYERVDLTA